MSRADRTVLEADEFDLLIRNVTKHLAGTENDHDQQRHASGDASAEPVVDTDYRGMHGAPDRESGAPAHDMTGIYPEDVYSSKGVQYYGTYYTTPAFKLMNSTLESKTIESDLDQRAWQRLNEWRGNPDAQVRIYRAVPLDAPDHIAPGDWVSIFPEYARDHGISALQESFKMVRATVRAGDLFTQGDSWLEWGWSPEAGEPIGSTYAAMRDGKKIDARQIAKHLQGTESDHDQSTHAGGRGQAVRAEGGRMSVTQVSNTTFRYEYGDFTITTNITGRDLLERALNGDYYDASNPPKSIEALGEVALEEQWGHWEGNFAMRHLSAAMMGLDHQYASGGEGLDEAIIDAVVDGDMPDDGYLAESAENLLSAHAATTHAMMQAIADNHRGLGGEWEGVVRRGLTVPADRYGEHPLLSLYVGDTLDMPLSAFAVDTWLSDRFLRGGEMSREAIQSDDGFVFSPQWRSVMFEFDTSQGRSIFEARGEGPVEVVTQGKFRVAAVRDEEREFYRPGWTDDPQTEDMRVITIQQTAVYNPRTGKYDALPGFVTLPDGRVVPVEEA